ncbi:hypothetical protein [Allomesorhizobium camelthorni]|uniref:Uncharacterized protein n=1 Tax=Allomesorhizobium camelthorni TaxID=475069 RepID=A0A6G4WCQ9_9HYPH|nr:hypothetical protein [Mesorhizobium camelthorni]NGO52389.1 hypothetical protein [Mesorhizobium camelthorni]
MYNTDHKPGAKPHATNRTEKQRQAEPCDKKLIHGVKIERQWAINSEECIITLQNEGIDDKRRHCKCDVEQHNQDKTHGNSPCAVATFTRSRDVGREGFRPPMPA